MRDRGLFDHSGREGSGPGYPTYFGRQRGATWLNVVNDQVMGIERTLIQPEEHLQLARRRLHREPPVPGHLLIRQEIRLLNS